MTPNGIRQVLASNDFWRDVAPGAEVPFPESFYVSPMARTLATANLTFGPLDVWGEKGFQPAVKEVGFPDGLADRVLKFANGDVIRCDFMTAPPRNHQCMHLRLAASEELDIRALPGLPVRSRVPRERRHLHGKGC